MITLTYIFGEKGRVPPPPLNPPMWQVRGKSEIEGKKIMLIEYVRDMRRSNIRCKTFAGEE